MSCRNSITCPLHPGIDTDVTDSRGTHLRGMESVRRRRKCSKCGYSWTTYELSAGDIEKMTGKTDDALSDIMKIARDALAGE